MRATTSSGTGVMFYLTGTNTTYGSVTMSGGATVTLSGPTSGTYMGVPFFQDRSITSSNNATFSGGATMQLTGSLYFPTTDVAFSNGTSTVAYTAIVANEVSFTGGASINYDTTGLKTGPFSKSVALVQQLSEAQICIMRGVVFCQVCDGAGAVISSDSILQCEPD